MNLDDICTRIENAAGKCLEAGEYGISTYLEELVQQIKTEEQEQREADAVMEGLSGLKGARIFKIRSADGRWRGQNGWGGNGKSWSRLCDVSAYLAYRSRFPDIATAEVIEYSLRPFDGKITPAKELIAEAAVRRKERAEARARRIKRQLEKLHGKQNA